MKEQGRRNCPGIPSLPSALQPPSVFTRHRPPQDMAVSLASLPKALAVMLEFVLEIIPTLDGGNYLLSMPLYSCCYT
jgi:hypothetical protein